MERAVSLKQMIQRMTPKGSDIIVGIVISENPLIVQAVNDDKLKTAPIISKKFYDEPLQIGEHVHLLSFKQRQAILCIRQGGGLNAFRHSFKVIVIIYMIAV